jgi:predicted dehydrogenase
MDSRARLVGAEGVLDVDLLKGTGLSMYSGSSWSTPDYEWLWQNGYPQEMADFARSIRTGTTPLESATDGRAVLEIMWAAYVSAAEGRTVELPYTPAASWPYPAAPWLEKRRAR